MNLKKVKNPPWLNVLAGVGRPFPYMIKKVGQESMPLDMFIGNMMTPLNSKESGTTEIERVDISIK